MESMGSFANDSYDGDVEDLSSEEDDVETLLCLKRNKEGKSRKTKEYNTIEKKRGHVESFRTNPVYKMNGKSRLFIPSEENSSSTSINGSLKSEVKTGTNGNAKMCSNGIKRTDDNEIPDVYNAEVFQSRSQSRAVSEGDERFFIQYPTEDPRFQRLIDQLVPNKASTKEAEKRSIGNEKHYRNQDNAVFFHDLCLKGTCRIIFKLMKIEI